MKVEEVMSTDLIVGYVPGTVKSALNLLAKHNVSGMPILKKDTKKVVGILTRTDIFKNADEEQLALIMSKEVHSVTNDQDIKDAAKLLFEKRIHGLPVVNKKKNLVGIISPKDILKVLSDKNERETENYFTNIVAPTYQDTPINIAMEIINITNENALPVLNDELKLIGIVTDGDLFKLSHIHESVSQTNMGMGGDEDQWTWEGIRDTVRLHYSTSEVTLPQIPVKEIMITDVVKGFKNTTVLEIANSMLKHDISHIPIVDANDRLIGMISDIDLMACMF
ncbi:MAG: CBS domain-containing protein [Thermoplasmatales archaeon]|nr:CBS domain-containing protein [Thermoplasmatales archaeon]